MEGDEIQNVTRLLFERADKLDWMHLNISERRELYEIWTVDPLIGGALSKIMPQSRVRVYIKDTVMGNYANQSRPDVVQVLRLMAIPHERITRRFAQPQAVLCDERELYTIAIAKAWKVAIMNSFERGVEFGPLQQNRIFFIEHTCGRFIDKNYRILIDGAAKRLGIISQWLD